VERTDASALHSAFAAKRAALAPLIADARQLSGAITREDIARCAHNATVAKGQPLAAEPVLVKAEPDCTSDLLARETAAPDTQFD
jgi:hypothetical protein